MADGNTPTYSLILPEIDGADGTWGVSLNTNLGSLDSLLSGGTALTAISVTGTVTAGGVTLGDNEKIQLGASQDLELFHDGTNSYVQDDGDGGLILNTTGGNGVFIHSATETMGAFHTNGAVNLYHDNAEKFATTATGIDVTGTVTASEGVLIPESKKLILGSETDSAGLEIYEASDGDSLIKQYGDGNLIIKGQNILLRNNSDQTLMSTILNTAQLFHRNGDNEGLKLETTNSGIDVTGTVEADAFSGTGNTTITDFITDVSASNNDTTVPTTAAVKSYVDNNDGDTTYTGGTGLTLDGTTFNVDAAQTQITSVGTLTSLTTGDTTINGNLEVKSTTADGNFLPEIRLKRDGGVDAGDDGDVLGALVFEGDNFDGTQKDYARIGVSIKDDGTGVSDGAVRGEIRFATAFGGSSAGATLEDPAFRIDDHGVHLNEITLGSAANFYNIPRALFSGLKYWENNGAGFATEVKCQTPTKDNDIKFPDASGNVVVATIAGGGINGGGGLNSARTTWSKAQMLASPNSTYVHYNNANTNDLVVSPPHIGVDVNNTYHGTTWKFTNNSTTSSKIILDLDGYGGSTLQYYTIMKYDGSASGQSATILSTASNLTVSGGGQITLTAVDNSIVLVEGIGYS